MLLDKLKEWQYYYDKLPLYLRLSYGLDEHFKMMIDILQQLDAAEDDVIKSMDILNTMYLQFVNEYAEDDYTFDMLDKIAAIYGVTRVFDVDYDDIEGGVVVHHSNVPLKLTNSELLKLIKARIIQNNFNGTYEQSRQFYDEMGLPVYLLYGTQSAVVTTLLDTSAVITENERKMFLAGLFTIKSMGIVYQAFVQDIGNIFIFDVEDHGWDEGVWV